ncbi:MAG TPA: hypothetical protein VLF88_00140 [Candidatus Babeliales bacterium]|nr:hypothetical protein [Candidatus Babeliales bacterium]
MKINQKGFGAVEGILVLIIVGLLCFIGWYVYDTKNKTDQTLETVDKTSNSSTTAASKSDTATTDKALITDAVTKDCESTAGSKASSINIYKLAGDYAAVTLACSNPQDGSNPTNRLYLKKNNKSWAIVVRGGGAPTTTEELKPFGFPANFLD